jgi:acyl-CoA reductase-like NAD-dependent aldehyde dehydrogenase
MSVLLQTAVDPVNTDQQLPEMSHVAPFGGVKDSGIGREADHLLIMYHSAIIWL